MANKIDEDLYNTDEEVMDENLTQEKSGTSGGTTGTKNPGNENKQGNMESDDDMLTSDDE